MLLSNRIIASNLADTDCIVVKNLLRFKLFFVSKSLGIYERFICFIMYMGMFERLQHHLPVVSWFLYHIKQIAMKVFIYQCLLLTFMYQHV